MGWTGKLDGEIRNTGRILLGKHHELLYTLLIFTFWALYEKILLGLVFDSHEQKRFGGFIVISLKMTANWDVTQPGRHLTTNLNELFWLNQTLICDSYSEAVCIFLLLLQLCWVVKSQVINKKMNEKQTSAMIKNAATSTEVRKRKIMDAVCIAFYPVVSTCFRLNYLYFWIIPRFSCILNFYHLLHCVQHLTWTRIWYLLFILLLCVVLVLLQLKAVRFNEDPCVKEFGISVGGKFEEVEARILDAPQLEYNVSTLNKPRIVDCECFCNWIHISWMCCRIWKFCVVVLYFYFFIPPLPLQWSE